MIIDCISDLHGHYPVLEGGDLLIVAGDLTARDTDYDWYKFEKWLLNQNYKEKILISGNHDNFLQSADEHRMSRYWEKTNITYLCDSGTEFVLYPPINTMEQGKVYERQKIKIWGSPWTKTFEGMNPHCKAFTCDTEEELAEKFSFIPDDIDILVTHCPPYVIYDTVKRYPQNIEESTGSKYLLNKFRGSQTLKLHAFGHIHEHGGKSAWIGMTNFINCSHVNEHYKPVNKPVRVIL